MVTQLDTESKKLGRRTNTRKTKVMVISKSALENASSIVLNGMVLEQVNCYPYIGVQITSDGRDKTEINFHSTW
jgi:hypothetical protein